MVDQIAVDGAEYTYGGARCCLGVVPPAGDWDLSGVAWPAGVSGDPGGSGVVGVATCTGRCCIGALGVGSVLTQFLCRSQVSVAKCGFTCIKGVAPWYLPCRMWIRSLIGQPKTHWAGDNFVVWSGVLRLYQHGSLELFGIKPAPCICVVHYHSL